MKEMKPEVMKKVMELASSLPSGSQIEIEMPGSKKGKKGKCPNCGRMMGEGNEEEDEEEEGEDMSPEELREKLRG